MKHFWPAILFVALTSARPAWAQSPGTLNLGAVPTKWVEVGGGLGTALSLNSGTAFPSLQARVNVTPRIAVDVVTDFYTGPYSQGLQGAYLLQAHQTMGASRGRVTPFVTYGAEGDFEYRHVPEFRYTLATGDTVVLPAHTYGRLSQPFAVVGGGGARVRLAPNLFLETGPQLWVAPGAALFVWNAGITVPIGRGR